MFRKFQNSNRLPNRYFPKIDVDVGCPRQDYLLKLAWFFTYNKSRHFPDLQVSKTFGILNLDEATIYGSRLRTIIFAEKLRDRSKILQLKTSYISLTRCYGEMPLCCRIKQIKKNNLTQSNYYSENQYFQKSLLKLN